MTTINADGAFKPPQAAQSQRKPGLEKHMQPPSESSKLEAAGQFKEYVGSAKLKDKAALITGGDSGIGRAVAVLMAREGAHISIVYLPEEEEDAQETRRLVEKEGRECLLFAGDLTRWETCRAAVDAHIQRYRRLNVLVNNASKQYPCADHAQIDLAAVEDVFRCNILQMMAMAKYALPHLTRGDVILNNASVLAFRGSAHMVDYAATKGAIVSFTRSLALQLEPLGIRVNAVAPGAIWTPIQVDSREAGEMKGFGSTLPFGRPGAASEVATSFVFLASADAAFYSGQVFHCYPLGD
ncbi:hypothetical protein ASPZODRAFT_169726 [Penicilliopsis zonata CBS 506.65]|uniref:Uncharacterized protein n=1 Tax=Penicilliopsis zonata CBS 506.65 TaxID=1073090 RepID=A0A1L9S7M7_9EURO|nr:hypothetical protein ASPZODRAFT_169726 [Penicilliopsis zonata CBS 506.65]OJJ43175.1 hypothetical protein ASPZODRAFT_169726 [Penicilliopsis zonata CBS 506.65]